MEHACHFCVRGPDMRQRTFYEDEHEWRKRKGAGYDSGRFFEFLGDQARDSTSAHRFERERNGWTDEHQRSACADALSSEVTALTEIARTKCQS